MLKLNALALFVPVALTLSMAPSAFAQDDKNGLLRHQRRLRQRR